MKTLKQQFKVLKLIMPDQAKKEEFARLLASLPTSEINRQSFFQFKNAPALALISILFLAGSGAGVSFAAQNALPGDMLYPVKLTIEKARLAVAVNAGKKTELHLEFAAHRLDEVEKMVTRKTTVKENEVNKVLESYEKTLDEAEESLSDEKSETHEEAASVVQKSTKDYEQNIARVILQVEKRDDGDKADNKIKERLERAREHTQEKMKDRRERQKDEMEIKSEPANADEKFKRESDKKDELEKDREREGSESKHRDQSED